MEGTCSSKQEVSQVALVDIYPSFMTLARFLPFVDPMQDVGDGAGNRLGEEFCLGFNSNREGTGT